VSLASQIATLATRVAAEIKAVRAERDPFLPTGAIASSIPRNVPMNAAGSITSGRLRVVGLPLTAGQTVTSLTFLSGSAAAASPTHWWFSLHNPALALCRQTADQLTAAWPAATLMTLALSSPYVAPSTGLYYAGLMVAATTTPTIVGAAPMNAALMPVVPILTGDSTTGLTTTAPNPAGALTAVQAEIWCYAS
jgi:hypothetical protein